ncbi:beta-propeller domain-containing protein [Asanoa sp. NPDC049573]|uniref:beta-propeller domain-containing protein n=1 Tax=Asanoa sp. NPDC049573 TaxID=3155396 RepID=UPI003427AAB5
MGFDSCADVLAGLKRAAKAVVTPWGFAEAIVSAGIARRTATGFAIEDAAKAAPEPAGAGYSGTNTQEVGVDEPDLVKTDGRRIVTVTSGVLRVVDAASRRVTGRVDLGGDGYDEANLLLSGDRALVLMSRLNLVAPFKQMPDNARTLRLVTVDLGGSSPTVVGSFTIDGSLVDARQVGATARVVVRSRPRIEFPYRENGTDKQRLAANRAIIDRSTLDGWLPRWTSDDRGEKRSGQIDCGAVRRPETYSGTSLLTVLSFDIGAALGTGDPTTIVADGDFVYGSGTSLYVANDESWRAGLGDPSFAPQDQATKIYRFDITGSGPPRFVASGSVPGSLLNQYAMSEFDGHLRVAATRSTSSSVYVLRAADMSQVGHVGGLGRNERIYAVRFTGPVGYVVTFRQTDPLYTLDLRNPSAPSVAGELKINGYSSYLHPIDADHVIGVGQDADANGRVLGTQVSVFDVTDLASPRRVAQHRVKDGWSEAESDPHAFLYRPETKLLVVPIATRSQPGALALRLSGSGLDELGTLQHPNTMGWEGAIRRSLMVSGTLWTVSDTGMRATDATSMREVAWVPFS